ncbi:RNA methyltransferase [Jiella sp. MQZ9-1]|uniref:RNA methyltransferase n=1 Tax=Jiella flava TaxID=2816857 RepID=A0A939FV18_9HYPH|nr:RNA methyltransferase [Jiella flava]MBO0661374.1 RNA methyltransferase [Jiella flava]MCD2470019.1 RNA methyltransferase [Jiella flava]
MPDPTFPRRGDDRGLAAPGRIKEIASAANPIVKDIRQLAQKRHREETGLFLVEGLKLVLDGLESGWELKTLVVSKAALQGGSEVLTRVVSRAVAHGADVVEASAKVLEAIARRDNPQSAIGVFRRQLAPLKGLTLAAGDVAVALDRVRDPGNLGTILRSVDAVGAKAVILIGDCVDPFAIETVRATMGSIFAVPVIRAKEGEFLAWRGGFSGQIVGTHMAGTVDYRTPDYHVGATLLLMGNEQAGLSDPLAQSCDRLVRIPQMGRADSLNLAVATGVMLFEARRGALTL